jgi:hypothetical protein
MNDFTNLLPNDISWLIIATPIAFAALVVCAYFVTLGRYDE